MSGRDHLRELVEALREDHIQEAISLLENLEDDEPLSAQELANLGSAREDIQHGRMIPWEQVKREESL
jgi:hypothetical protein